MNRIIKILRSSLLVVLMSLGLSTKVNAKNLNLELRDILSADMTQNISGRVIRRANEASTNKISEAKAQVSSEIEGKRHIRFVAGLDSIAYEDVKFDIVVKNGDETIKTFEDKSLTTAYTHVEANGKVLSASEVFGVEYNYLVAYTINDVPSSAWGYTFEVTFSAKQEGATSYTTSSVAKKVINDIIDADNKVNNPEVERKELKVISIEMTGTYGDSCLVKYGDFEMLIDAGTTNDKNHVQAALKEFVEDDELDILMVSHLHADHIGAMTSTTFFSSIGISVKTIIDPGTSPTTTTARNYESMRKSLVNKGSTYYNYYNIINDSSIDTIWNIDEEAGVYMEFFNTGTIAKPSTAPSELNETSIAFAINYLNNKWFFAGDLPTASESTLVDNIKKINSDYFKSSDHVVMKACHHGSNGSNSDKLLSFVKPDIVFTMAGIIANNQKNQTIKAQHPYSGALSRMKKYTTKVYWSSINGLSIFTSTGNEVSFDARGRTVDYYYKGAKVSRDEERYVTIFESKWYLMM